MRLWWVEEEEGKEEWEEGVVELQGAAREGLCKQRCRAAAVREDHTGAARKPFVDEGSDDNSNLHLSTTIISFPMDHL